MRAKSRLSNVQSLQGVGPTHPIFQGPEIYSGVLILTHSELLVQCLVDFTVLQTVIYDREKREDFVHFATVMEAYPPLLTEIELINSVGGGFPGKAKIFIVPLKNAFKSS